VLSIRIRVCVLVVYDKPRCSALTTRCQWSMLRRGMKMLTTRFAFFARSPVFGVLHVPPTLSFLEKAGNASRGHSGSI
jgi:hypothetical protein